MSDTRVAGRPDPKGCPWCGSRDRDERGLVPGFTGMPVSCGNEWHDGEEGTAPVACPECGREISLLEGQIPSHLPPGTLALCTASGQMGASGDENLAGGLMTDIPPTVGDGGVLGIGHVIFLTRRDGDAVRATHIACAGRGDSSGDSSSKCQRLPVAVFLLADRARNVAGSCWKLYTKNS